MPKFTNKRKKELLENKYILTFAKNHIIYTEEFRKKVILELSKGKNIVQVFKDCGFDTDEIGMVSIKANKHNWTKEFIIENIDGKRVVKRIKGAYPILNEKNKIIYIPVEGGKKVKTYSQKEINLLGKNKYVEYIDKDKITFTNEFKRLFMREFNKGKGNLQIFIEAGLDPNLIDKRRVKTCTRNWKKIYKHNPNFDNSVKIRTKKESPEEKKKRLNDIKKLQKRVNELEMENEFLKKVSALRKG